MKKEARYDRLLALLPALDQGHGARALAEVVHEDGLFPDEGSWTSWLDECRPYLEPRALETADLLTCRKILMILVRQDRFDRGALSASVQSGLAARLVRRVAELVEKK